MLCPKCQAPNEDREAKFCFKCGHSLTRSKRKRGWWLPVMVLAFCVLWTGMIFGYFQWQDRLEPNGTETDAAIDTTAPTEETEVEQEAEPVLKEEKVKEPTEASPSPAPSKKAEQPAKEEKSHKDIIHDVQSRVYTILTKDVQGSGFLYKEGGLVVTNAHVAAGYSDIEVRNSEDETLYGRVVGISNQYDVALIQVDELKGTTPLPLELQPSELGTEVIALGSPLGLTNTASMGSVTGLDRSFETEFQYEKMYQVDTQMSPGSSGGPLVDASSGKVIGINAATLNADDSIGFSIPLYTMEPLLTTWVQNPMAADEVKDVFAYSDDYAMDSMDTYTEEVEYPPLFDEMTLESFIYDFRSMYESALLYEDFSYVEGMLYPDSPVYGEYSDYINEISGQGMEFIFTSNDVTDVSIQEDYAVVTTYEVFDFKNAAGEWSVYERVKDYTVIVDEYDSYKITDIYIYE
ncbi:trypsin-like peptidase domain-containing protein [Halobacillus kuroshimensis]|uniref:Trypsin-like peptidase domain-containing protein n=1 Tax=Halobacillus kuroshimensis TaxID=302481 RepID=A0ABS3DUZ5_9BACI|nr:trypsin-like peptidase domain-containing protein [Halobacillus kuroshimensis]MBN8235157.1 trypsin-like peptidase domain-containing protein [Halobacillus kuroshimensis]